MKYYSLPIALCCALLLASCSSSQQSSPTPSVFKYYSDYFVFISDDTENPLVIPYDLNWSPTDNGYEIEFKGWYGTQSEWPIAYLKHEYVSPKPDIPNDFFQHKSIDEFAIYSDKRELQLAIDGQPEVLLKVPQTSAFVAIPDSDIKTISAARTLVVVDGKPITGWLLHENIRAPYSANKEDEFGDFTTFFWIPIVVDGMLYHFEQHDDKQTANRWRIRNDKLVVESAPDFDLSVVQTIEDSKSGRKAIPNTLLVKAAKWQFSAELASVGGQVGHGQAFPKGLAYYRQSLLTSTANSKKTAHGMLELILENN